MIHELVNDYANVLDAMPREHPRNRILTLLDEALRRDVHFIERHPTTLFQCLWNSCWWYDSPEAAGHYQTPEGGWRATGPPWKQSVPSLSALQQSWRRQKEQALQGFRWLRSLRPPQVRLGAGQQFVLRGHERHVECVTYSSDGRWLASASEDGTVRIWHAASAADWLCLHIHQWGVRGVAVSPDGLLLACACSDGVVRVRAITDGKEVLTLQGHTEPVTAVCFSPDGRRLASSSWDFTARVWDLSDGSEALRLTATARRRTRERLNSVCYSPKGDRLAAAADYRSFLLWDAATGAELMPVEEYWSVGAKSVCFSPDGRRLATASSDPTVSVWDASTRSELLRLEGHTDRVLSVQFSPDGRRLASASADGTVRVWDAACGVELFQLRGHTNWVTSVCFSADGERLASASWDMTVRVWNTFAQGEALELHGHSTSVGTVCFSSDGQRLASASGKNVRVWNVGSACTPLWSWELNANVGKLCFARDGGQLACGAADGTVRVWNMANGAEASGLRGFSQTIRELCFSPDGQRLAVAALLSKTVLLWFLTGGPTVGKWWHWLNPMRWLRLVSQPLLQLPGEPDPTTGVCFSPDGRWVVFGGDKTIHLLDALSGDRVRRLRGDWFGVKGICFSPDGRRLAGVCMHAAAYLDFREIVRVWDPFSGVEVLRIDEFAADRRLETVLYSSDGERLAGVVESKKGAILMNEELDRAVHVWDASTGASLEVHERIGDPDLHAFANGPAAVPCRPFRSGVETVLEESGTRRAVAFFPDAPPKTNSGRYRSSPAQVWAWSVDHYIHVIALEGPPSEANAGMCSQTRLIEQTTGVQE